VRGHGGHDLLSPGRDGQGFGEFDFQGGVGQGGTS
jgi:hypothetical protein